MKGEHKNILITFQLLKVSHVSLELSFYNFDDIKYKDFGITDLDCLWLFYLIFSFYSNLRNKVIQLLNPIALTHMDDFVRSTSDIPTTDHLVDIILHLNVIRLANLTSSTINVITSGKVSYTQYKK